MSDSKIDCKQLEQLRDSLEAMARNSDDFLKLHQGEIAARLLAKVIKRTPVGTYPSNSGKVGGTLRRGWTAGTNQAATSYADSLTVHHFGDTYVIEIINPVEYASYVEFGHRTANGTGWVEGKYMLTLSEQEIRQSAPGILEAKLKKWLSGAVK